MLKNLLCHLVSVLGGFCLTTTVASAATADEVARIFANHCVDCHSLAKGRTEKNLDLTDLVTVGGSKRLIDTEKPEESKLYDLVRDGDMPLRMAIRRRRR